MKRLAKILGILIALPLLVLAGALIWALWNKTSDDQAHVAAKALYLERLASLSAAARRELPNILIVYYDDLGFGDLGFTGSKAIRTPNIDRLAEDGVVLANYHSPSPVCSPSRAGMLTGRLPPRAGVPGVLMQSSSPARFVNYAAKTSNRLPAEEITIADALEAAGYRTAMIGKWHLGDIPPSLPNGFGFESFFGSRYSNDMKPFAIWRDGQVAVKAPADQTKIDRLYTDEAVRLIAGSQGADAPFFIYFAHNFPHIPLAASPENLGRSQAGLYGDVIEALDDGIGRIVAELKRTNQFDNTILIITSDNGPWYEGSPGKHRGRKGQTFEGGMRVPFLIHWPAGLQGHRTIDAMAMGTDLLPTLLDWLDLPLPADRRIDGASLRKVLEGKAGSAHEFTYFYSGNTLAAISDGRFKFHPAQPYHYIVSDLWVSLPSREGPWLFDLTVDPDESYNVRMKYPKAAARLKAALEARNREMESNKRGWK